MSAWRAVTARRPVPAQRFAAALLVAMVLLGPGGAFGMQASNLSAEQARLASYAGTWNVAVVMPGSGSAPAGTAIARPRLGGRFLEIEFEGQAGPIGHALYTLGFDDRHGAHTIVAMDDTGSYFVTARGTTRVDEMRVAMYGSDDDPVMAAMGYAKEFAFVLELDSDDAFALETRFIDNRTETRTEILFLRLEFTRAGSGY